MKSNRWQAFTAAAVTALITCLASRRKALVLLRDSIPQRFRWLLLDAGATYAGHPYHQVRWYGQQWWWEQIYPGSPTSSSLSNASEEGNACCATCGAANGKELFK
jgi:hypothetical protein